MWAILSGIAGNLAAYQAVSWDIKRQSMPVEHLFILGDLVSTDPQSEKVIQALREPVSDDELIPNICRGWWEEQCLILYGLGSREEPTELVQSYGVGAVKELWDAVSRETVEWFRELDFGFVELDCLLVHGSSIDVSEALTPNTPGWQLQERLERMAVNHLFCGRSGESFIYRIEEASLTSRVITLDRQYSQQVVVQRDRQIIGVGSVGRKPHQAIYTLYDPSSQKIHFRTLAY